MYYRNLKEYDIIENKSELQEGDVISIPEYSENILFRIENGYAYPMWDSDIVIPINSLRNKTIIYMGILGNIKNGFGEWYNKTKKAIKIFKKMVKKL